MPLDWDPEIAAQLDGLVRAHQEFFILLNIPNIYFEGSCICSFLSAPSLKLFSLNPLKLFTKSIVSKLPISLFSSRSNRVELKILVRVYILVETLLVQPVPWKISVSFLLNIWSMGHLYNLLVSTTEIFEIASHTLQYKVFIRLRSVYIWQTFTALNRVGIEVNNLFSLG